VYKQFWSDNLKGKAHVKAHVSFKWEDKMKIYPREMCF